MAARQDPFPRPLPQGVIGPPVARAGAPVEGPSSANVRVTLLTVPAASCRRACSSWAVCSGGSHTTSHPSTSIMLRGTPVPAPSELSCSAKRRRQSSLTDEVPAPKTKPAGDGRDCADGNEPDDAGPVRPDRRCRPHLVEDRGVEQPMVRTEETAEQLDGY